MFSHAQSLLINHKNIFECFSFFWKGLCFCTNCQKFQKLYCLVLATQSPVEPVAVHHRDFSRLTGDSLEGKCFNRKKDLEYFSKIWNFMFFAAQVGDLCAGGRSSRERYTKIFAA